MYILIAMFVMSYIIGRITVLENSVYKSNEDTVRFTFGNKFIFFILYAFKVVIAYYVMVIFIPDESLRRIAIEDTTDANLVPAITKAIYSFETRVVIACVGTLLGDIVGIFKIKN